MSPSKNIAFFGATGGSVLSCLASCLKAEYKCTALVRSADKLTNLLTTAQSVPQELITNHLIIIVGDTRDTTAVAKTLFPALLNPSDPASGNNAVECIVSGLGSYPKMKKGHLIPQQEDPTLCEDGVRTILKCLKERKPAVKPGMVTLSTTGMSPNRRDYPLLFWPLYKMLHVAHLDKKRMENLTILAVNGDDPVLGTWTIVRCSLLKSGPARGLDLVRCGEGDGMVKNPQIGYTIRRNDVGLFLYEKVVKPFEAGKKEGTGTYLNITY